MVEINDRLNALLKVEANQYRTYDYLPTRVQNSVVNGSETATEPAVVVAGGDDDLTACAASTCSIGSGSCRKKQKFNDNTTTTKFGYGGSESSGLNERWREKICEWAYQVIDHFELNREVVSIAMNHLDRYLACFPSTVDKNLFHLLSMTCLYLSIKLNEYKHLLIPGSTSTMDTILQLSRGVFTLEQMERMEYDILQRLQWYVHPPTAQIFLKHFLLLISLEQREVYDLAKFLLELSVMDYFFVPYKESEVAMAALLNTLDFFPHGADLLRFESFQQFDMNLSNIQACRERLTLVYAQSKPQTPSVVVDDGDKEDELDVSGRRPSPVSVLDPEAIVYTSGGNQR